MGSLQANPNIETRKLLSDGVTEYLSEAIFRGDIKPGDKIVETKIAKALNVSQGTVREAIKELKSKGFLETSPFKGSYVRQFRLEELKDYFRTRTEIEMIAVRWAIEEKENPENIETLRECIFLMESYRKENDNRAGRQADMNFHKTIVKSANSPSLLAAWEALNHSFWFNFGIHLEEKYYVLERQVEIHARLFDCLKNKEIEGFRKELEAHFVGPKSILKKIDV